ncbi:restriction endonuclease [Microvirgula aerodenitrificans]|uniref:restriction endonuclease n=1 Tax=Microvirgula aerodenitrificans TaxID=57480 RepID=UPI0028E4A5D9|nr:restriction endonuclease [Microvirgula aerodenitrificans]
MDKGMYAEAIEYELLTQAIYRDILAREGVSTANVQHNVSIVGRSGVEHQVDVYWEFKQAGITHRVLIECKNYASNLTLEKARNFFAVVHDIGNCIGIMVTKTGYQSGAATFCKHYGLALKLLRKPTEEDWEGRIKEIHINMIPRVPVSSETHPIICNLYLRPDSEEQDVRLKNANRQNPELVRANPSMRFLGKDGLPITEELRWWIPRQLNVLEREDGGPYKQLVKLTDHYISENLGNGIELIQVIGVVIDYYVETLPSHQVVIDATETVSAILKDFVSGEWEHVRAT